MPDGVSLPRYCSFCREPLESGASGTVSEPRGYFCPACGNLAYAGPRVLVLSFLFAEGRLLLMQRGVPPYVGRWAPPGGFVEAGESPEAAAIRETGEEVGVLLHPDQLLPHAIVSLPRMNQLYVCFLGILDRLVMPRAALPEALDARWFSLEEYAQVQMWEPAAAFDIGGLFHQVQTGEFYFNQLSGEATRTYGPYSAGRRGKN